MMLIIGAVLSACLVSLFWYKHQSHLRKVELYKKIIFQIEKATYEPIGRELVYLYSELFLVGSDEVIIELGKFYSIHVKSRQINSKDMHCFLSNFIRILRKDLQNSGKIFKKNISSEITYEIPYKGDYTIPL